MTTPTQDPMRALTAALWAPEDGDPAPRPEPNRPRPQRSQPTGDDMRDFVRDLFPTTTD